MSNFDLKKYLIENKLTKTSVLREAISAKDIVDMISKNDYEGLESLPADKQLVDRVISLLQNPENKKEKNIVNQMSCKINEFRGKNTFLALLLAASSILGGCSSGIKSTSIEKEPVKIENVYNKKLRDYTPEEARAASKELFSVLANIIFGENHGLNLDSSSNNYSILMKDKLQRTDKEIIKDPTSKENFNKLKKLGYMPYHDTWEELEFGFLKDCSYIHGMEKNSKFSKV
jgi:hypothetical protein